MLEELASLETAALAQLQDLTTRAALDQWKTAHLGRSAPLSRLMTQLGTLSPAERPAAGQRANAVKRALEAALEARAEGIRQAELARAAEEGAVDVTLPGRPVSRGRRHPATLGLNRILRVFGDMGFQVFQSRSVETDDYNFTYLNMPPHHPARDMWDTFHTTTPGVILRTHTSPGQIHAMRRYAPEPIRVVLPGMCFRYEQVTTRSELQFFQVEGLAVGRNITLSDLKGTLSDFARRMFGQGVRTRFRADHFPFTEPSAEMDVECYLCGGRGCSVCKYQGWLEILGCGMVHPTVLRHGGYDPEEFSGFAFGLGPQRITMLGHGITDIRYFWQNDTRFLEQF